MIIALLILCGIADAVTTLIGLKQGNSEANPVAARLFDLIGPKAGLLLLKTLCTGAIIFVLHERPSWWLLGVAFLAGYAFVLRNNVKVIAASKAAREGSR